MDKAFVMPFGKHKGQPISTVPTHYLEWLEAERLVNGANTSDKLMIAIVEELNRRSKKPKD